METRRILVVANQTACGGALLDMVKDHMTRGRSEVTLLVPATHPEGQATWTEGGALATAERTVFLAMAGGSGRRFPASM